MNVGVWLLRHLEMRGAQVETPACSDRARNENSSALEGLWGDARRGARHLVGPVGSRWEGFYPDRDKCHRLGSGLRKQLHSVCSTHPWPGGPQMKIYGPKPEPHLASASPQSRPRENTQQMGLG